MMGHEQQHAEAGISFILLNEADKKALQPCLD